MHGSIVHPYTWFNEVHRLPPGSVCKITESGLHTHRYWEPTEPDNIYDLCDEKEWGRRLHDEVQSSIVDALGDAGRVRVFFSGGEDSRVLGSLVPDDVECVLTTVLDAQNREYRLARRAAQALGRKFEWIPRPKDYYKSAVQDRIEMIGPGWDFRHTHFLGDIQGAFQDADALVGGYLADTLFKTYHMSNVEEGRGGIPDSLERPDPDEIDVLKKGKQQTGWFAKPLVKEVRKRRADHHRTLKEIRPITAGNWHALWPISNALAFSQYLCEHRIGPQVIEPFLFSRVYRLAAEMPDQCREDQQAFHHAFGKRLGLAGWLPVSYGGVPRFRGYLGQMIAKIIGRARLMKRYVSSSSETQGPWTSHHYGWSPVVPEEHFDEITSQRVKDRLNDLLAERETPEAFLEGGRSSSEAAMRALALAVDS
jgi:asparagine synthetase B (glutamine-hydrolysing)